MAASCKLTQLFLQKETKEGKSLKHVRENEKKKSMSRIKNIENKINPTENKGFNFSI